MNNRLFMTSRQQNKAARAEAVRQNREAWRKLGFAHSTVLMHEDDKVYVSAQLDVLKAIKLKSMLGSAANNVVIARRNMSKLPSDADVEELRAKAENSTAKTEILGAITAYVKHSRSYKAMAAAFSRREDEENDDYNARIAAEARAVVACNLAAAYWRLAVTFAEHSEKLTIFSVDADDIRLEFSV